MTTAIEINGKANSKIKASCSVCKGITNHLILCDVAESGSEGEDGYGNGYAWDSEYQIIQCCGCDAIRFRKTSQDSETYDYDDDGNTFSIIAEDIYPSSHTERVPINDDWYLPTNLRAIYHETLSALNHKTPVLAGIGIRAIVETVCKQANAEGHNLELKIKSLVTKGIMTQAGSDVLHQLRALGNEAAHEVKPPELQQLNLALDVIENVLQGVFIFPMHAQHGLPKPKSS